MITCIPMPDDAQKRCSSCIRLKVECKFYTLDVVKDPHLVGPVPNYFFLCNTEHDAARDDSDQAKAKKKMFEDMLMDKAALDKEIAKEKKATMEEFETAQKDGAKAAEERAKKEE